MKIYTTVEIDGKIYTGKLYTVTQERYEQHLEVVRDVYRHELTFFELEQWNGFIYFTQEMMKRAIIKVNVMEHREEMILDGVLCYRDDKNNPFIPFTKEELTQKIVDLEQRLESQYNNWCEDADKLDRIREIVK